MNLYKSSNKKKMSCRNKCAKVIVSEPDPNIMEIINLKVELNAVKEDISNMKRELTDVKEILKDFMNIIRVSDGANDQPSEA